jgi:hypothetical protein
METSLAQVVTMLATVISAAGAAFAAVAAFKSAGFAQAAQEAAQTSEKQAAVRQLMLTANEVLVEARRVESRGGQLKLDYRTLFSFGGSGGSSREAMYLGEVDKKLHEVTQLADYAKPFVTNNPSLVNGPIEEISSREIRLAQTLNQVLAVREDLELEQASVDGQNTTYREIAIRAR